MVQLYDVVLEPDAAFVMRAPLHVIQCFLNLHPSAVRRVEAETENGGVCALYNDRLWGRSFYRVLRARGDLGETRLNLDCTELLAS